MKKDITNRQDIEQLVNLFYDKVKADPSIGFIFNDIVKVNWEKHLPVMYDFWENTLFYTGGYNGNPMEMHLRLHQLISLKKEYFDQWTHLFIAAADELFEGEKTILAKQRALSIATVMQIKIAQQYTDQGKIF